MNALLDFLKRHSLVCGILLMFLLTWPIDLSNSGLLPFKVPFIIYLFLGWGFVFAAVIMTGLTLGRQGVAALLKRYLYWRVSWKWYAAALLLPAGLIVLAIYLHAARTGVAPDYGTVMAYKFLGKGANLPLLFLPYLLYEAVANGEEIGWRGYVLPRLQAKHSALAAAFITRDMGSVAQAKVPHAMGLGLCCPIHPRYHRQGGVPGVDVQPYRREPTVGHNGGCSMEYHRYLLPRRIHDLHGEPGRAGYASRC